MGTAIFSFKKLLTLERMVKKRRKQWTEHSRVYPVSQGRKKEEPKCLTNG